MFDAEVLFIYKSYCDGVSGKFRCIDPPPPCTRGENLSPSLGRRAYGREIGSDQDVMRLLSHIVATRMMSGLFGFSRLDLLPPCVSP